MLYNTGELFFFAFESALEAHDVHCNVMDIVAIFDKGLFTEEHARARVDRYNRLYPTKVFYLPLHSYFLFLEKYKVDSCWPYWKILYKEKVGWIGMSHGTREKILHYAV